MSLTKVTNSMISGASVNVLDKGADPTGVADSTTAIQAAIDSVASLGGGEVLFPAGTYLGSFKAHPVTAGYYCLFAVPANVTLVGMGIDATIIKLAANQTVGIDTSGVSIIYNKTLTGGDTSCCIENMTIDGNGANQTKLYNGIIFIRTQDCKVKKVKVKNVKGTTNFPPNETFHFDTQLGINTTYVDCVAEGSAGTQGSGFSANSATNISWVNCVAWGMSAGMGFTAWNCTAPTWVSCFAYSNGTNGFNVEESISASFNGCQSGGLVAYGTTPYPYPSGQTLGNSGAGFVSNGSFATSFVSCHSSYNGTAGIGMVTGSNTYGDNSGAITGGSLHYNNQFGMSVTTGTIGQRWTVKGVNILSNTVAALDIPAGYVLNVPGEVSGIAVPATTVPYTNQYPFDMTICIYGGTGTLVQINGTQANNTLAGQYLLPPGSQITLFYSAAPTWLLRLV